MTKLVLDATDATSVRNYGGLADKRGVVEFDNDTELDDRTLATRLTAWKVQCPLFFKRLPFVWEGFIDVPWALDVPWAPGVIWDGLLSLSGVPLLAAKLSGMAAPIDGLTENEAVQLFDAITIAEQHLAYRAIEDAGNRVEAMSNPEFGSW